MAGVESCASLSVLLWTTLIERDSLAGSRDLPLVLSGVSAIQLLNEVVFLLADLMNGWLQDVLSR